MEICESKKLGEEVATHTSRDVSFNLGNRPDKAWTPGGFQLPKMRTQKETPPPIKIIPKRALGTFQPIEGRGLEKDI